jgi:hypothetical protein
MKSVLLALLASLSFSAFAGASFDLMDPVISHHDHGHGHGHGHHHHKMKLYKCTAVDSVGGRFSMTSNRWKNLDWKAYDLCTEYSHRPDTCRVKTCKRIK